jgi:hypothetical protein
MSNWLWQWKWALVIAIFAGPVFAYYSYNEADQMRRVLAQGVLAVAEVRGGEVQEHSRGGNEYTINAGWVDAQGQAHGARLPISETLAQRVVVNDTLMLSQVHVRYIASDPDHPVIVEDAAQQLDERNLRMWLGIIAAIAGLILSPLIFWWERRLEKKREAEIDAVVAENRQRQAGARS